MIKLLRIDDRLIHGQVAVYWVKSIGADTIVVANDKHATNAMLKMSLSVGKPAGVKMEILTVEKAIEFLNNPVNEKNKILLVTGDCQSAADLVQNCPGIHEVNIGGIRHSEDRVSVAMQVFLNRQDLKALDKIASVGKTVYLQEIPTKEQVSLNDVHRIYDKKQLNI